MGSPKFTINSTSNWLQPIKNPENNENSLKIYQQNSNHLTEPIISRKKIIKKLVQVENPEISVIMAAYNTEKYIEESIKSILDQTFSNFELIIANDASKDNTLSIIRKYQ